MSDLLGIGASGVRAYQTALTVVGSNISNASTAGYVRRQVKLEESPVSYAGGVLQVNRSGGGGVDTVGVTRAYDQFKAAQVRTASTDVATSETAVTYLTRIQDALTGTDPGAAMTAFFNAAKALAADPTSVAQRTQMLANADGVATAFRATASALSDVASGLATDASTSVETLNGLSASLATLNGAINGAKPDTTQQAALFDQRDQLLDRMASLAGIAVSIDGKGMATVRLNQANGPALVDGVTASRLTVDQNDSGTLAFSLHSGAGTQVVGMAGGALAGLADASARVKDAQGTLDDLATRFADAVNAVQAGGVGLDGQTGAAMFTTGYASATALPGNSGKGNIEVGLAAGATPHPGGYTALYDSATAKWTLSRTDGSAKVSGTGTLVLDGVTVALGGSPVGGDGYAIATGDGAAGLATTGLDPKGIAAASRWTADAPFGNAGTATLSAQTSGTPTASRYALSYSGGMVTIRNAATNAVLGTAPYVAGQAIIAGGLAFTFTGQPADGDSFTVGQTGANSRDNTNLSSLESARQTGGFETGVSELTNGTATALASRKALAAAQGAIRDNATAARDDVSGVNLDQEAVDLLKFQQAYQASSRVITIARETFQSILDIH